jgi:hypothetical protein
MSSLFIFTLLLISPSVEAATTFVTNENDIRADGSYNWNDLPQNPAVGDPVPQVQSNLPVNGIPGLTLEYGKVQLSSPPVLGDFSLAQQGNNWQGDFPDNEYLLLTHVLGSSTSPGGPVVLRFNNPVEGVGLYIQHYWGGSYVASIEAYDVNNQTIGNFSLNASPNTAVFLGVLDSEANANIKSIIIDTGENIYGNSTFAISGPQVQLYTEADSDGDGIPDSEDDCPDTPAGEMVNSSGCSVDELCPCENEWKNHGSYVRCVAHASEDFMNDGLITEAEKDAIVSEAAESICDHKN